MSSGSGRRHTCLLASDDAGIAAAAALLRGGGLVAFPTETVYGLGADALASRAVRGIFQAKGRPADDPLIVHLAAADQLEHIAHGNDVAARLAKRFWPGPLTLVLPKRPNVPPEVTAGLPTVAVRVPAHAVAQALLRRSGLPLAAPSANLFGRPSPTRAAHVLQDLDGRIDAVLDGGPTTLGVESTIVDLSCTPPRLLRPGGLAAEEIESVLGQRLVRLSPTTSSEGPQSAPGLMSVHYAPRTPLTLIVGSTPAARVRLQAEVAAAVTAGHRVGVVALEEDVANGQWLARSGQRPAADGESPGATGQSRVRGGQPSVGGRQSAVRVEVVGSWSDPAASAARLFEAIRALDAANLDVLFVRELADPSVGLGQALFDRVRRAAQRIIDS
ncbi:MAG: L-threonylcarbamoyladenylate synthase [Chloroflexota bacterium]|nr:L-threonylcarbamoyladenylate synthase [Chloroflexota bacterium]